MGANLLSYNIIILSTILIMLAGCSASGRQIVFVTATPSGSYQDAPGAGGGQSSTIPTPQLLDPTSAPRPDFVPTPNPTRPNVIDPSEDQVHVVSFGETLSQIATAYGVSVESILEANALPNGDVLLVGQTLVIPLGVQVQGTSFKTIPDSELVLSPSLINFDTAEYLRGTNSFLERYAEELDGVLWTGADIVDRVALEQSLNPRLLLALLEHESQWLSNYDVTREAAQYPLRYIEKPDQVYGLYRQLDWAGKMLQTGYYGWKLRGLSATLLADGKRAALDPGINAGTAGVQMLLSQTRTYEDWRVATEHTGLYATYARLFGDPFENAVEPLVPSDLSQPDLEFPWAEGETWYYTGGPHGGWGSGSAFAALDFVPSEEINGCELPGEFARAVADGVIARSEYGIVVLDLDGDGFEGTGWTIFYLHMSSEKRAVKEGQKVRVGDKIALPSCEGGVSFASHLHIARRYNGEWISADCSDCLLTEYASPQLRFGEWLTYRFEREYDGSLVRGDDYREACACRAPFNTFNPWDR